MHLIGPSRSCSDSVLCEELPASMPSLNRYSLVNCLYHTHTDLRTCIGLQKQCLGGRDRWSKRTPRSQLSQLSLFWFLCAICSTLKHNSTQIHPQSSSFVSLAVMSFKQVCFVCIFLFRLFINGVPVFSLSNLRKNQDDAQKGCQKGMFSKTSDLIPFQLEYGGICKTHKEQLDL